jgi:hypothetical protein
MPRSAGSALCNAVGLAQVCPLPRVAGRVCRPALCRAVVTGTLDAQNETLPVAYR